MSRSATNRAVRNALAAVSCATVLAACAGENLFSLAVTAGEAGPEVEITEPTSGDEKVVGDSLLIEATVTALSGASTVSYRGIYEVEEDDAYTQESAEGNGLTNLFLSNYLRAAPGQRAGTAIVIVSVTDLAGETGADTVSVTITAAN